MAWYLRKSFGFGPLRLNLSKSGLGYSFGIKGARIGTGPRGNYIHLGRQGIYYRRSLGNVRAPDPAVVPYAAPSIAPSNEITTVTASALHESSADTVIQEIREKRTKVAWAPTVLLLSSFVLPFMLVEGLSAWVITAFAVTAAVSFPFLSARDRERKTVDLHYELDQEADQEYAGLCRALQTLASAECVWSVISEQGVLDTKYSAGAGKLIDRNLASVSSAFPKWLNVNVNVWNLRLGVQTYYCFPDHILVVEGSGLGAAGYHELEIQVEGIRFIEHGSVPSDAEVIDQTWQYVNRSGGPDRRFSYNPVRPVVRYGEVRIHSGEGLNLDLQVSNTTKALLFAAGLTAYAGRHQGS